MAIEVGGLLKVTKILVFKNNLLDRKLYHFGGNWASSLYNRGTKVVQRWRPGRVYSSCENSIHYS